MNSYARLARWIYNGVGVDMPNLTEDEAAAFRSVFTPDQLESLRWEEIESVMALALLFASAMKDTGDL